jgi:transposase InsO family protein
MSEPPVVPSKWNQFLFTEALLSRFRSKQPIDKPWAKLATVDSSGNVMLDKKIIVPIEQVPAVIKREYEDPKTGLVGRDKLFQRLFAKYIGISRKHITDVLRSIPAHSLTTSVQKPRPTKPIVVLEPNKHWQMDLIDLSKYAEENKDYRYVLNIVDLFSKKLMSIPLLDKSGASVAESLDSLLRQSGSAKPAILQSDNGSEFKNTDVDAVLKRYKVHQVFSKPYTPTTQSQVERVNGTLKKLIHRGFIAHNNYEWYQYLQDYVSNYNNSIHSVTGTAPTTLSTTKDTKTIDKAKEGISKQAEKQVSWSGKLLKVGDTVRIALKRLPGQKDFVNWSYEVYPIEKVIRPSKNLRYATERYKVNGKTYSKQELLLASPEGQIEPLRAIVTKEQARRDRDRKILEGKDPLVLSVPSLPPNVLANLPLIPAAAAPASTDAKTTQKEQPKVRRSGWLSMIS